MPLELNGRCQPLKITGKIGIVGDSLGLTRDRGADLSKSKRDSNGALIGAVFVTGFR